MESFLPLAALRVSLQTDGLVAYVLPVNDATLGELPAPHLRRLQWLTGFGGSAGMAVVMPQAAAMFVDGRYTLQVRDQVDTTLFETHNSGELSPMAWLAQQMSGNAPVRIGYDAWLFSHAQQQRFSRQLAEAGITAVEWVADAGNRIDALWANRPTDPCAPATLWPIAYAGRSLAEKAGMVAEALQKQGLASAVLTNPESPCWLLNLRGGDVPTTPQLNAAALVVLEGGALRTTLFVDGAKMQAIRGDASLAGVTIHPMEALPAAVAAAPQPLGLDVAATPRAITLALEAAQQPWVVAEDPCALPRACKHTTEQDGMREAHRRDGVAVIRFLHWLDAALTHTPPTEWPTELDVVARLRAFREEVADFWGDSFDTIAGFGPNGAIVHYRPEPSTNLQLAPNQLLLLDSGGQYPMGTTDITRTIALGAPSDAMRAHYTRVLQGHIDLAMAQFPSGTAGSQLDALARQWLWRDGLDYDHGTGHGVGTFLNVHEGPQRISKRAGDTVALRPGMVVSNEPGYYASGAYGIRIENLVMVQAASSAGFLNLETLTCVPLDRRLVIPEWLTAAQTDWWNRYHAWVLAVQGPQLVAEARTWLEQACQPL